MKQGRKHIFIGIGISAAVYGMMPLLFTALLLRGTVGEDKILLLECVAAGLSALCGGVYINKKGKCSSFISALLAGPAIQLLFMLIGFLSYTNGFCFSEKRWLVCLISFLLPFLFSVFFKGTGKRKKRTHYKTKTH